MPTQPTFLIIIIHLFLLVISTILFPNDIFKQWFRMFKILFCVNNQSLINTEIHKFISDTLTKFLIPIHNGQKISQNVDVIKFKTYIPNPMLSNPSTLLYYSYYLVFSSLLLIYAICLFSSSLQFIIPLLLFCQWPV